MAAFTTSHLMKLMATEGEEAFGRAVPDHARCVGEKSHLKKHKYDVIKELKKADLWFELMRRVSRFEHPSGWWPTLKMELENGEAAGTSCIANLASLFIRWKLPVTPFLHALCRMAAERTRTASHPPAEPLASEWDDDSAEDNHGRFADITDADKLDVSYWSTLGKLPGKLLEHLAAGDPSFKLWQSQAIRSRTKRVVGRSDADRRARDKERAKVREEMYNRPPMEQMQADKDWMEAVKYAADAQVKLGRAEVLEGLKQAALIRSIDRTRAMTQFNKYEAAAQKRCKDNSGLVTLTPEKITEWSDKKALALKAGEQAVAALEEPVRQLFAGLLEERKVAARRSPVFTLPGSILPAAPQFVLQEPTSMDPLPSAKRARQGEPAPKSGSAANVAATAPVSLTNKVITPVPAAAAAAAASPIMVHAPVSVHAGPASNVSVSVHIEPASGRANRLPTSLAEVSAAQRLQRHQVKKELRKRKRGAAAPKEKKFRYCKYHDDYVTDWDEPCSEDKY
jgi:hypothetical protein